MLAELAEEAEEASSSSDRRPICWSVELLVGILLSSRAKVVELSVVVVTLFCTLSALSADEEEPTFFLSVRP